MGRHHLDRALARHRTGRAAHIEFAGDALGHHVVQLPATGPAWAVFNRAGAHPYVVHVYEPKERTLRGMVEATEDPAQPREALTCDVVVSGVCLER